jgi:hypothetical protein
MYAAAKRLSDHALAANDLTFGDLTFGPTCFE